MKVTMNVQLDREEVCKVLTDYALEKCGRPQGASVVSFQKDETEVTGATVSFNGVPAKK
jgi:hypothetical protein